MTKSEIWAEMARRKVRFHKDEKWDEIQLWGLFDWGDVSRLLKTGELKTKGIERLVKRRVLEKTLPHFLGFNKVIAFLYTSEFSKRLEKWLLSFESIRNTLGGLRMQVRKYIYERA